MTQLRNPLPTLTGWERNMGIGYLFFQLFLLPSLLQFFNFLLPYPVSGALVNFLYFTINAVAVTVIFSRMLKKNLLRALRAPRETLLNVAIGLAAYWLCMTGISVLMGMLVPDFVNHNDGNIAALTAENYWLTAVGSIFLVPIAEEALHRGLVFGSLYPKNGVLAYLVSAALFSSIHLLSYVGLYGPLHLLLAFLQYLPAGLILAYAYRRSGTLLCPMLIHAAVNAIGILSLR